MASTPEELIERTKRLLQQQRDMYGGFSAERKSDKETELQSDKETELQSDKETELQSDKETELQSDREAEKQSRVSELQSDVVKDPETQFVGQDQEPKSEADLIAECSTLDELRALCEQAEVLKTDLPNTNLVFGVGNPNADLMIIGEAPGENEDKQGEPFVGAAGQLLDKIMAAINFQRSDIYIANILKHRPPNNRDPKPEERERSLPYLLRQIEIVDPKLILCVGRVSATTLLGQDQSLKSMRQKFHEFNGRELMATYHPAALLRNQQWKRPTWEDVQQLRARYDELGGKP